MIRIRAALGRRGSGEPGETEATDRDLGLTLIELLVSMAVFSVVMGIITVAIVSMLNTSGRDNSQATNLENGNRVITKLDHEVRYANAISTPGTGADGNYYVEYSNGNFGQAQVCTQWRYNVGVKSLQWRKWNVTSTGALNGSASTWATSATNVSPIGSNAIFSITPTVNNQASVDDKEQLVVEFQVANGAQSTQTAQFQTTLTAFNSTSGSPPTSVCAQVGRSS